MSRCSVRDSVHQLDRSSRHVWIVLAILNKNSTAGDHRPVFSKAIGEMRNEAICHDTFALRECSEPRDHVPRLISLNHYSGNRCVRARLEASGVST